MNMWIKVVIVVLLVLWILHVWRSTAISSLAG